MFTTIMKCVAMVTLLMGMFWHPSANLWSYFDFVISAAAVLVIVQAVNLRKYAWAGAFAAVVCIFNPIQPIGFSSAVLVGLQITSAALFAVSLQVLRTSSRMTIASITEANPKTQSL